MERLRFQRVRLALLVQHPLDALAPDPVRFRRRTGDGEPEDLGRVPDVVGAVVVLKTLRTADRRVTR